MAKWVKVPITRDAQKLWSCENFVRITSRIHFGKLPKSAGQLIRIDVSRAEKSPWCDAECSWPVHQDDSEEIEGFSPNGQKYKVCSHQVDCD